MWPRRCPAFVIFPLLLVSSSSHVSSFATISVKTTATIQGSYTKAQVLHFLATPSNWPQVVLSSWSVEDGTLATNEPFQKRGDTVRERIGIPPILLPTIEWECASSNNIRSPKGIRGLASNCRMLFEIADDCRYGPDGDDDENEKRTTLITTTMSSNSNSSCTTSTNVRLTIEYAPENALAQLAVPVLALDNAIALNVLLPYALQQQQKQISPSRLEEFRMLMGTLYGIAGLAHVADLLLGSSALFTNFGWPVFADLSATGQLLALFWCAMGPIAFVLSRVGLGDVGLVMYGVVELSLTALANQQFSGAEPVFSSSSVLNAVLVQAIVYASWLYSASRDDL